MPLGRWMELRHGAPYWTAHRADLHAALMKSVRASPLVRLSMGAELAAIEDTGASVTLKAAHAGSWQGDDLLQPMGCGSMFRNAVSPGNGEPRLAGRSALRAVVPASALPAGLEHNAVHLWQSPGGVCGALPGPRRRGDLDRPHRGRIAKRARAGAQTCCPRGYPRPRPPLLRAARRAAGAAQGVAEMVTACAARRYCTALGQRARGVDRRRRASRAAVSRARRRAGVGRLKACWRAASRTGATMCPRPCACSSNSAGGAPHVSLAHHSATGAFIISAECSRPRAVRGADARAGRAAHRGI